MNHSAGGLIQTNDNEGITIYRNLLIDNGTRNFKVKGLNQYVNNVVYNWGTGGAYIMGGDSQGHSSTVIENNYFITGPCNVWRGRPGHHRRREPVHPLGQRRPLLHGPQEGETVETLLTRQRRV